MAARQAVQRLAGCAERGCRFGGFCAAAIGLMPLALHAVSRHVGLGLFASAVTSGVGLAVGVRLVGWWLRVERQDSVRA